MPYAIGVNDELPEMGWFICVHPCSSVANYFLFEFR